MDSKTVGVQVEKVPASITLTTFFFLGSFSIISQTVLLRELLVVALGNEIIFGISFTHWLMGIFTGAFIGGYLSDKTKKIIGLFICSIIFLCILSPIAITLIRILYSLSGTEVGTCINFFKVFSFSALIIFPFSFFIGFMFPFAAKLNLIAKKREKSIHSNKTAAISQVYIFEAMGALFGGLVFSFIMVGTFNHYFCVALFSLLLLILTASIAMVSKHRILFSASIVLIILNLLFLTPLGNTKLNSHMIQKRWNSFSNLPLVYSTDSKYQNIAIGKNEDKYNLFTNGQFVISFPEDNDNMILASHIITQHKNPRNILIIGEAISGLAKHLLKFNVKSVVSVEIDPILSRIVRKYLFAPYREIFSDKRFFIHNKDGRRYVKHIIKKNLTKSEPTHFDIILLNMPEPSTLYLNRFYTLEFFQDVSKTLTSDGIFVLKITSSENYFQGVVSDYTVSIYNTIKRIFPHIVIAPGVNNFFFASKSSAHLTDSPEILGLRYKATGIKPEKLGLIFKSIYPEEKTRFIKKALETHRGKTINTDKKPVSTFYYNKILGWYSGTNLDGFFDVFENISLKTIILIIILLLIIRFIFVKAVRIGKKTITRLNIIISVIVGGFAGISLELLIIFTFQNLFGYVYQLIGFIIALFMLGLPLGAYISTRILGKQKINQKKQMLILLSIQMIIAFVSFVFPQFIRITEGLTIIKIMIFSLTILTGMLVGSIFPVALNLYIKEKETGKAAGIIDAFDHFGAAVGAFFTGAIFLPILGITASSYLLSILAFTSSLLLLTNIFLHNGGKKNL